MYNNLTLDNSRCITGSSFEYSQSVAYGTYGTGAINNSNQTNQMKESTKELYKLVFVKTVETEYTYEVLAESLEDAKEMVASGMYGSKDRTLSVDTELVLVEDSIGNEVEE
jgi:hypothetical protein